MKGMFLIFFYSCIQVQEINVIPPLELGNMGNILLHSSLQISLGLENVVLIEGIFSISNILEAECPCHF